MKHASTEILLKTIPISFGFALAWLGVRIVKNEKKIHMRKLELIKVLEEKSYNKRIKLMA